MGHRRGAERLDRGNDRLARPFRLEPRLICPTQPAKSASVSLGLDPALAECQADGEPSHASAISDDREPEQRAGGRESGGAPVHGVLLRTKRICLLAATNRSLDKECNPI